MDHSEAIRLDAPEKYLLGELPPGQREEFEEHYFSCLKCAKDVKLGAIFIENARHVQREAPATQTVLRPSIKHGWADWFRPAWSLAAVLALVGVISYQNIVTIPSLRHSALQPETLTSFSLLTAGSRGGETTVIRPQKGRPLGIYIDVPVTRPFAYYTLEVMSNDQNFKVQVTGDQAKDTIQMLIPAERLQSGKAELVIRGGADRNGATTEIVRYPFEIQVQ